MRRAGRGLLRATIASIVAVAVGPVGIAMAIPPTVTIESPVNESVTNPTPSFSGTGEFKTLVSPLVETCSAEPSIEGQPKGQTVVEPAGATFTVTEGTIPSGCSAATIQWQVSTNGGPWNNVSGSNVTATSATLSINSTSTSESGNKYRAELTNLASPSYSNAATLTVNPAPCSAEPSIEGQPKGQTVVEPAGATFTVTEGTIPSGCSAATIQWQVSTNGGPWNNVSGSNVTATSATLSINSTSTSESGNKYRAELTNLASPSYSNAATLTVNPAPCSAEPSIEGQPKGQTVVEPAGATFTVTEGTIPSGCSAATIQWQVSTNGGPWNNVSGSNVTATSATLSINSTSTSESGNKYRAELTNLASPSYSNAATLTVNPAPCSAEPSIEGQPKGQTVVEPAGATFTVTEGTIPSGCSAAT